MTLRTTTTTTNNSSRWREQLVQSYRNIATVIDACDHDTIKENMLCGIIYVTHETIGDVRDGDSSGDSLVTTTTTTILQDFEMVSREKIVSNGDVCYPWLY
jgi:hypothetical protein